MRRRADHGTSTIATASPTTARRIRMQRNYPHGESHGASALWKLPHWDRDVPRTGVVWANAIRHSSPRLTIRYVSAPELAGRESAESDRRSCTALMQLTRATSTSGNRTSTTSTVVTTSERRVQCTRHGLGQRRPAENPSAGEVDDHGVRSMEGKHGVDVALCAARLCHDVADATFVVVGLRCNRPPHAVNVRAEEEFRSIRPLWHSVAGEPLAGERGPGSASGVQPTRASRRAGRLLSLHLNVSAPQCHRAPVLRGGGARDP